MARLTRAGSGAATSRALAATLMLALESARREGVDLSLSGLRDQIRQKSAQDPLAAVTTTVVVSSALFFAAERGVNEKVKTFGDALAYCATSLSVGYHDIFPRTEAGKAITGLLHTLGPALAARALDAPAREVEARTKASEAHETAVLRQLEAIACSLKSR
jgi:voltage-gated potassium channel